MEPLEVPSQSSFDPGWNSQERLATLTLADKRRRLSPGLELWTNLQSQFSTREEDDAKVLKIILMHHAIVQLSCPQSYYTQAT